MRTSAERVCMISCSKLSPSRVSRPVHTVRAVKRRRPPPLCRPMARELAVEKQQRLRGGQPLVREERRAAGHLRVELG